MIDTTYKVGIYLRLSREDQLSGESSSISTQRSLLLNYIKDNNLLFVSEYVDDGVSGTTFNRKGFNRMLKDCEQNKINMIITKDTSRLGRDHIEFGYYVERYFPEHNIRYVAVNDGIDTFNKNSSANDMLVFKSALNDMYVKDISNKLRSSLYTKKRNGLFVGCYAPYGYQKNELDKHKLEIDNKTAPIVKRIFNMFIGGMSISQIGLVLTNEQIPTPSMAKNMNLGQDNIHYGVWSTKTIDSILKNPTYMGNLTQCRQRKINYKSKKRIHTEPRDWIVAENTVMPIIDKEIFLLAQTIFKSNKNRGKKGNGITNNLLLRGLIFCRECHHTIGFRECVVKSKKKGVIHRVYGNCNYWIKRKKQNVCTPHSIKYQEIEDIVIHNLREVLKKYVDKNKLKELLEKYYKQNNEIEDIKKEIIRLDNRIESINNKIDICYNDKLEGNITLEIYKRTYKNFILNIDDIKRKKEELKKKMVEVKNKTHDTNEYNLKMINEIINVKRLSRAFICLLIDKIEIDEEKNINIYYKFSNK